MNLKKVLNNLKKQWQYVVLIFLVAFNLRLGISSVPPVLAQIKDSLGLSNVEASLLTSVPVICMGVLAFFVARVQKQWGRRQGIFILLLLLGASTLSRALISGYVTLLLTTFFIGAGIAIIGPLVSGFIKEQFPHKAGLLIGVYSLSMGLGSVSVSSSMLPLTNFFNQKWQYALAVWGVVALVVAFIWKVFAPKEASSNTAQNKQGMKLPLKKPVLWKMVLFFGIQSGIFYGFSTWISAFLVSKGISTVQSVFLLTLFTAVQMLGSFVIPALMDKLGSTRQWIVFCTGVIFAASIGLLFFRSELIITLGIILMALGASGLFPIAMLLPIRVSKDAYETSIWTSMVQAFGYILGGIIPVFIGVMVDWFSNYDALLWQVIIGTLILFVIGLSDIDRKGETNEGQA